MCGIFCALAPCSCEFNKQSLNEIYGKCYLNLQRRGPDTVNTLEKCINTWDFVLASSVLWLQGSNITQQPIETEKSLFLFNGDIFNSDILTSKVRKEFGDTIPLLEAIENSKCIITTLSKMQGPFALVLLDKVNFKLYFGRDTYGKRSLLIGKDKNNFVLTSVGNREINFPMLELPALGVYCIDLNSTSLSSVTLLPWHSSNQHFTEKLNELQDFLSLPVIYENKNELLNSKIGTCILDDDASLFESIESLKTDEAFKVIKSNDKWMKNIDRLQTLLENAIERRIENQPKFCSNCIKEQVSCNHCLVGILFSGGLDCAILSLLADKFIDPIRQIDLMNVAFEKGNNNYETPDRLTAKQTLQELQKLRPHRKWNLLEINITQSELNSERSERISHLIFPLESILDESLGCALWFAARGQTDAYGSPCRVLLVGMGADELFGGYTRHRAAYKRGGWDELSKELDNDWKNISHRNLARDDRVISDHGRQVRTPYLDENVVEFVKNLYAWDRCYPSERVVQGLGDKLLLRSLAFHLGLTQAAVLRKRALQFGSRIANSKENAHDKSPRL